MDEHSAFRTFIHSVKLSAAVLDFATFNEIHVVGVLDAEGFTVIDDGGLAVEGSEAINLNGFRVATIADVQNDICHGFSVGYNDTYGK